MSLESQLTEDLKTAMKAKDQVALRSIRAIKAAILLQKTDGSGEVMTEDKEIKMLQKLVKQRKDSVEMYTKGDRPELAEAELAEIAIIEKYLPAQMSEEELESKLKGIIAQTGVSSMKDMGKIMGIASKQFAGKADGKAISAMVKKLLG